MLIIRTPTDLGAMIRERRITLGLDQRSLAEKAGTSRKWLIEVENGKPRAEIGLIFRTLKALNLAMAISDASRAEVPPKRSKAGAHAIDINRIIDSLKQPR